MGPSDREHGEAQRSEGPSAGSRGSQGLTLSHVICTRPTSVEPSMVAGSCSRDPVQCGCSLGGKAQSSPTGNTARARHLLVPFSQPPIPSWFLPLCLEALQGLGCRARQPGSVPARSVGLGQSSSWGLNLPVKGSALQGVVPVPITTASPRGPAAPPGLSGEHKLELALGWEFRMPLAQSLPGPQHCSCQPCGSAPFLPHH